MRHNDIHHPFLVIPLSIIIALVYMTFVYKSWASAEELFLNIPSFLITGISVGMFFSILPFDQPYRSTFIISSTGPFISGLFFLFVRYYISTANAGEYSGSEVKISTQEEYLMFFVFFVFISTLFGAHRIIWLLFREKTNEFNPRDSC